MYCTQELTTGLASRLVLLLGWRGRLGEKKSTMAFFRVLIVSRESLER